MIRKLSETYKNSNKEYVLFIAALIFMGIAQSVDGSTLNNFLKEKMDFVIMQRSALEMPRELPGLLVVFIAGLLSTLGDIRIAAISNLIAATGMLLFGLVPTSSFGVIIMFSFIYSSGQHLVMPFVNSIAMSFAKEGNLGRQLGRINATTTAALVFSSAALWALFKFVKIDYSVSFSIGAAAFIIASVLFFKMKSQEKRKLTTRFVYRKEYNLYYFLSILYGARKQIFLTFGPWVLVDIFKQKVTTMTIIFFVIASIGIFVKPYIGYLIDKFGEKMVLRSEAGIVVFLCLLYAFAIDIFPEQIAVFVIAACYVADQTVSSVSMARATYMRKIAIRVEDVSPSLSLGLSLDHVVSMFLPALAGYVWYINGSFGYKYVFLGGAAIAILNFFFCKFIVIPDHKVI